MWFESRKRMVLTRPGFLVALQSEPSIGDRLDIGEGCNLDSRNLEVVL